MEISNGLNISKYKSRSDDCDKEYIINTNRSNKIKTFRTSVMELRFTKMLKTVVVTVCLLLLI